METILYLPQLGANFTKVKNVWIYTREKRTWTIYNTIKIYDVLEAILNQYGNHYCIRIDDYRLNIKQEQSKIIHNWLGVED